MNDPGSTTNAAAGRDDGHHSRDSTQYRAWLLRCWQEPSGRPGQPATWRFQLEDAETGEKRSFADLGGLVGFLRRELALDHASTDGPNG